MTEAKLPYRPFLQSDESPASLLIRAAEGNGYGSVLQLLAACGVPVNGIGTLRAAVTDPARYAVLLRATGLRPEDGNAAYRRSKPTKVSPRLFMGVPVPERLFREEAEAFCPQCLAELPYWRRLWSLRPYVVCHLHGVVLLRQCPDCGRTPALNRGRLVVCECGADWARAVATADDAKPSRWLYDQLKSVAAQLLKGCFEFWLALEAFDGQNNDSEAEQWRLRVMIAWCYDHDASREEIKRITLARASRRHPRVQFLPFLKRKGALTGFARQVLARLGSIPPINHPPAQNEWMSVQDAGYVLGVNSQQLNEFFEKGVLTRQVGRDHNDNRVAIDEVEKLLEVFQVAEECPEELAGHHWRPPNRSLINLIEDIRQGRAVSAGYDLEKGLNYLRIRQRPILSFSGELKIGEVSLRLGVHPEVVRSFIKKGWLSAISAVIAGHRMAVVSVNEVERFDSEYVTAGALARSMRLNTTTMTEKLENLGVSPVAGPRLDGMLVYLFRRSDLVDIDLSSLQGLRVYETRAGRRPLTNLVPAEPGVLLTDAATRLQISTQQTAGLLQHGILVEEPTLSRGVRVTEASLTALLGVVFSPACMLISEAAALVGYTEHQFRVYFIETEVVPVVDLYIWRFVHENDLVVPKWIKDSFLSASEAGEALGMHRSFFPNLERQGEISPHVIGTKRKVKFYSRVSILQVAIKLGLRFNINLDTQVILEN